MEAGRRSVRFAHEEVIEVPLAASLDHKEVIAYCRVGERSSHTWFGLKYLLGYPGVKNYSGGLDGAGEPRPHADRNEPSLPGGSAWTAFHGVRTAHKA